MNAIIQHIEKEGMPVFWQFVSACLVLNTFIMPFLFSNQNLVYSLLVIASPPFIIGLYVGFNKHKEKSIPRLVLVGGVAIVGIGASLHNLIYFKFPISTHFALMFEEVGMILIAIFAYIHMLMFEKKFNIKGLAIDFSLLVISGLFVFLLVSPNALHTLFYIFDFDQQILVFNLFIGSTILCMSFIHYLLTKSIGLTDGIRTLLTILLVIHFSLEMLLSFEKGNNPLLMNTLSRSTLYLAGALAIAFVFLEKMSLDYPAIAPTRLGNLFMWVSSIFAIIAIPLGLVIRSALDAPPLDLFIVGMTSILISSIVIWRIIILIKNSNQQKKRLNSLMQTSSLTGLPNYQGYLEQLTFSELENILVIHINIEDFKSINDLYGRDAGDEVLKSLGQRLKQLPKSLLAAHIQSDQFLVAFHCKKIDVKALIETIQEDLGIWDTLQGKWIAVPLTIGASHSEVLNPEKLAKQAEIALKKARKEHSSFALYSEEKTRYQIPRHELRQILQQSVDDDYLPVHFQPIYDLKDGTLKSLELLIRVDSKEHGLLLPGQFLEQAKSYALLTSLTQICIKMIAKHSHELGDITINVNLPPYMLKSAKLLKNFIQLFEDEKLDPKRFCIEITEDEEISAHELIPAIKTLREQGFSIAMDDFGTGYSSLDRLSVLEVDTVKIDRSILLTAETGNTTILEWAISLTKRLGVSVVVEGVETLEQLSLIKLLGADSVQGFLYSKPVPAFQIKDIALNSNDIKVT
ncbi:EAL domain-containing protein [Cocleimonas sp. KMM 6892]|uniref:EAL domain-containing protein n=1 Tax=unclassified Cocleimonas TaxID=2639732 RepID=UPI002DB65303|nr:MULTISPECIES: EAL domain-containing protein [unclassified Cocleimonas]MEB8433205.1 EAL domain-containing protein [Cocleimonas sp. KMM 6892]MEC4715814.1 EAL domain-containing protein [Cocleimonas sp. KMM 6895]MEC4745275.1 EAL domain-containing protein [Cocleimonas sp. KMM 6896]